MSCPVSDFTPEIEALSHANPWVEGAKFKTKIHPKVAKLYASLGVQTKVQDSLHEAQMPDGSALEGPFYNANTDTIGTYPDRFYSSSTAQAAVLLHELVHWTKTDGRTGRTAEMIFRSIMSGLTPTALRLLEESIADVGAVELMEWLGIKQTGKLAGLLCARIASSRQSIPDEWWQSMVTPYASDAVKWIKERAV